MEERLQIADLYLGGAGVRAIAVEIGRSPATVSRELSRNGSAPTARRAGKYAPYAAQKQAELTASLVDISIKENHGSANVKAAEKRRQEVEALARAEAFRQEAEGQGRAAAIRSVGEAEGSAIRAKSEALEGAGADKQLMQTVMLRLAEAFETARVPLVPQIQLGGGADGNAFSTLLGIMTSLRARELSAETTPRAID